MGKFGIVFDKILSVASEHSPAILTGLTCAGVVVTAVVAVKAGPKIRDIIDGHKESMNNLNEDLENEEVTEEEFKEEKKEIIADTAKKIVPATLPIIIFLGLTILCAVLSNKESARRIAAATAAYEIASMSLKNEREAIKEIVPKKYDEIRETAVKKGIQRQEMDPSLAYSTGNGDILCKDIYTGVQFRSSHNEIAKAIIDLSKMCLSEDWVRLSDLYDLLGIKESLPFASDIGWSSSNLIEGSLPIMIVTAWDKTGTIPVIGLDYEVEPFHKEGGRFRY